MIPTKIRVSRRVKALKIPKNLERLYKEGKCRECSVVVTKMDFAKILGKFTKVKIQYESSSTPKGKKNSEISSSNTNSRLKSKENGMVQFRRNAYNSPPIKEPKVVTTVKKTKRESIKTGSRQTANILKENNTLKKTRFQETSSNDDNHNIIPSTIQKRYVIVFEDPVPQNNSNDLNSKVSLPDLLAHINDSILPSDDWCIDFFPKRGELKDDKVYDRIAAELEDLMYSEKPTKANDKVGTTGSKVDDFPSIMDILNDNSNENKTNDQSNSLEVKSNLDSSDVEAMLLGKTSTISNTDPPTPMDVDNGNLIDDVNQFAVVQNNVIASELPAKILTETPEEIENPHSPSILDEALQKGIEEHLPCNTDKQAEIQLKPTSADIENVEVTSKTEVTSSVEIMETETTAVDKKIVSHKEALPLASIEGITHLVFKKCKDGTCFKSVTCPKNLKYDIEIDGKSVEFIGAPRHITNSADLQVLLEIVNESDLSNIHVLH